MSDAGGSKDLWNVGKLLPDYMELQPRRQPSSYSPPWEPQILLNQKIFEPSIPRILLNIPYRQNMNERQGYEINEAINHLNNVRKSHASLTAHNTWRPVRPGYEMCFSCKFKSYCHSYTAFTQQAPVDIPDIQDLGIHFCRYTKDRWRIEPTSCSNFKKGFTSGLTGTNSTFGYTRGPSLAMRVGEIICCGLALPTNVLTAREYRRCSPSLAMQCVLYSLYRKRQCSGS
jgi:hypothetical protein